jgi:hypothetical protein
LKLTIALAFIPESRWDWGASEHDSHEAWGARLLTRLATVTSVGRRGIVF